MSFTLETMPQHDHNHDDHADHTSTTKFDISDDVSAALKSTAHTTACTSCDSSLDPMFDDANLTPFDVLLYPPHNPFSAPEDQLLQFASETHPGNVRFLVLLDLHRPFYMEAMTNDDNEEMDRITSDIVTTVISGTVPGGKFLEWTITEEAEGDYGDAGDDGGMYGQEGQWDDLGTTGQARMLVLRGLRNAPVSSAFDELPSARRESAVISKGLAGAAAVAGSSCKNIESADAKGAAKKGSKKKSSRLRSSLKSSLKMFKKSGNGDATAMAIAASAVSSSAAAAPTSPSSSSTGTLKRSRRSRSASDSDSIRGYAKQTRRRRLSGLPPLQADDNYDAEQQQNGTGTDPSSPTGNRPVVDPIPRSSLTKSDVVIDCVNASCASRRWSGNKRFNSLIDMYRPSYEAVRHSHDRRHGIVAEIVATVYRGTTEPNVPGRFLVECPRTGKYAEISCDRALVSVEQCLNEEPSSEDRRGSAHSSLRSR